MTSWSAPRTRKTHARSCTHADEPQRMTAQPNRLGSARPSELTTDSVNEVSTAEGTRPPSVQVHAVSTNDVHGVAKRSSDDAGDSAPAALAESLGPRLGTAAAFGTTEHFNLQTARAITVSEANGRATAYLAALSHQPDRAGLHRTDVPARNGVLCVRPDPVAGVGVRGGGDIHTSGSVVHRGDRVRASHRRVRDFYLRLSPELAPYVVVVRGSD